MAHAGAGHARRKAEALGGARGEAEAAIRALHLQADAAVRALEALVKARAQPRPCMAADT